MKYLAIKNAPKLFLNILIPFLFILSFLHAADYHELYRSILSNRARVSVFEEMRKIAESRNLRVYLFGGSAATWVRYNAWDIDRLNGDTSLDPKRFDYFFDSIFKSTQDVDLLVVRADGKTESAQELSEFESAVRRVLPGIRIDIHGAETTYTDENGAKKDALLADKNIKMQNSDTASHGAIELTSAEPRDSSILDIRFGSTHEFINAFATETIHYIDSEDHKKTDRARAGDNPHILSVIRFLSNSFRYSLKPSEESVQRATAIIKEFDPKARYSSYVVNWIETNARKLYLHAIDLESAWEILDQTGLRQKLILFSKKNAKHSREPLYQLLDRKPLGSKGSKAEKMLKWKKGKESERFDYDGLVTHETPDIAAYESIMANPRGIPNFLVSQNAGEMAAAKGEGVYVKKGTKGSANPKSNKDDLLAVQLIIHPGAEYNEDFKQGLDPDHIVIRNRDHLRVQISDDSLPTTPTQGFEKLLNIDLALETALSGRIARRLRSMVWQQSDIDQIRLKILMEFSDNHSIPQLSDRASKKVMKALFAYDIPQLNQLGFELLSLAVANDKFNGNKLQIPSAKRLLTGLDINLTIDALKVVGKLIGFMVVGLAPYYAAALIGPWFLPLPVWLKLLATPGSVILAAKFHRWVDKKFRRRLTSLLLTPYTKPMMAAMKKHERPLLEIALSQRAEKIFVATASSRPEVSWSDQSKKPKKALIQPSLNMLQEWKDSIDRCRERLSELKPTMH